MSERRTQQWARSGLLDAGRSAGAGQSAQPDTDPPRRSRRELREARREEPSSSPSSYRPSSAAVPVSAGPGAEPATRRQRSRDSAPFGAGPSGDADAPTPPRGYRPAQTGSVDLRPSRSTTAPTTTTRPERPSRRAVPDPGPATGLLRPVRDEPPRGERPGPSPRPRSAEPPPRQPERAVPARRPASPPALPPEQAVPTRRTERTTPTRRPAQADSRSVRTTAEPARESAESLRARTLAEADRVRLEASRHTRDLSEPAATRTPPARRPASTESARTPTWAGATTPAAREPEPAWPPTGARLAWPPTGPGQDRKAARQTSADVTTSHLGATAPAAPVRASETPTTPRRALPAVPEPQATSPAAVERTPSRRTADGPVRTTGPVGEPTEAADEGRLSGGRARGSATAPSAAGPSTTADVKDEPAADEASGDGWALFSDKTTDHVVKPKRPAHRHRARTFVVMTVVLAMVVGVGYVVVTSFDIFGRSSGVSDYTGEGEGPVDVTVRSGDSGAAIAKTLAAAEVVATEKAFVNVCRASTECQSIQPGTYTLKKHMSAAAALAALLNPDNRKSGRVTVSEGLTVAQTVERISNSTGISMDDLKAALDDPASFGLPAEANGIVEGWLFPGSYDVDPDATAVQVLTAMVDKTKQALTDRQVPQDQWERVLITASIVEREGGVNKETGEDYRPMIARAIENRLAIGKPLEVDATTIYHNPDPDTPVSEKNKDASNPYNTYKHVGLPPGPIASPGEASIDAVLHPATGDWVYWVTINYETKETRFAVTFPEHQQNVALLRQWYDQHTASPEP